MSATVTDEPDHAIVENNGIELSSVKKNSHADFNGSGAVNNHPSDSIKSDTSAASDSDRLTENMKKTTQWVQFDDDDEKNETSGSFPVEPSVIPAASKVATVTTVDITPRSPVQNNKPSPSTSSNVTPAVLATESVHINLNNTSGSPPKNSSTISSRLNDAPKKASVPISIPPAVSDVGQMRTIELSTGRVREGFANGDVIVTLLPINTKWPWITPAVFRPELVPEELMAQGLTLTVEEYVNAMETLVNDYRFTLYNVCYKRVLVCWILFAFCVLLALLFSGLQGIALFSLGVGWLFLNAAAIFLCMWIKLRLSRGLEKCLARVNKQLVRHKILLVLDDRGRISCHKVNLCFLYFDPAQCIAYLNDYIERSEQNGSTIQAGWEARLDLDVSDIVIQGSNPTRLSRKQERGSLLYLRYGSRWGNEVVRGLGDVSITEPARHCANFICPCQYIERHISCKPRVFCCSCCAYTPEPIMQYNYQ